MTTQLLFTTRGYTAEIAGRAPIGHARVNDMSELLQAPCGADVSEMPAGFVGRTFDPQHPRACLKCSWHVIEEIQTAAGVRYRIKDSKYGRYTGPILTTKAEANEFRRTMGTPRRYDVDSFVLGTGAIAELPGGHLE